MKKNNDYQYLARNIVPSDLEIVSGKGVIVFDQNKNSYLDLCSQTLNLNLGHHHPVVMEAVRRLINYNNFVYYQSSRWKNHSMEELAKKLVQISPEELSKVNLKLCNGGDANEDAFKRVRKYHRNTGRDMIVAQYRSHHGESCETLNASGKNFHKKDYLGGSAKFLHINPVYPYRKPENMDEEDYIFENICSFESLVKNRGDIAGIIMELVQVNGGVILQPKSFVRGIEEICRKNDIKLIVDEVQTAFGWFGKMFASEDYGIRPDVITLGKALTAGFPALAAALHTEELDNLEYGESEYTNGGSTLCCEIALANIKYLQNSGILETIEEKHNHFVERLKKMKEKYRQIGDVRGYGLILGIELVKKDKTEDFNATNKVYEAALKNRLILRKAACNGNGSNVLIIKPPIIISHDEIEQSMDILDKSLKQCLQ